MKRRIAIIIISLVLYGVCTQCSRPTNESALDDITSTNQPGIDSLVSPGSEMEIPQETSPTETAPRVGEASEPPSELTTTPTLTPTMAPDDWKSMPILPIALSETAYQIYLSGLEMGNNPQAFSKVGDCNSIYPDFLGWYEYRPETIRLGEYAYLQVTLDYFAGSWGRESLAAKVGLTSTAVMAPLWNDWRVCESNETPLFCEYRIQNPSFAIISFGTNDVMGLVDFEPSMRRVIEETIALGIVPILSTKPDNIEGDHSINRTIVELALEYDLPLWNFWAAVQHLPDKGMEYIDHLSYSSRISWVNFEARASMTFGWTIRNLSGLQLMDRMRELVLERDLENP